MSISSIESIFLELKSALPELELYLASGGLPDCKHALSDVDIVCVYNDYRNLISLMPEWSTMFTEEWVDRVIYRIPGYAREVNIYATDNTAMKRSILHRSNEIRLLRFPLLSAQAIILKQKGWNTEASRTEVLWLYWDPYEIMTRSDLLDIAKMREDELKSRYDELYNNQTIFYNL